MLAIKNVLLKMPEELHRLLKSKSALAGKTLPRFIMDCLEKEIGEDSKSSLGAKKGIGSKLRPQKKKEVKKNV